MWIVARYVPTSLFSLKPALATASGAQTLLVPTPYAIKMALVDCAIRQFGVENTISWWPAIRSLQVALALPRIVAVNKTFIKILRKADLPKQKGVDKEAFIAERRAEDKWPLSPTIAFREFVQFDGEMGIALQQSAQYDTLPLDLLMMHINYFGKRGGFFQIQSLPDQRAELDQQWTLLTEQATSFPINGTLQMLDDCGAELTWEHINVYDGKNIRINATERVLRSVVLPMQLISSSYRYSLYERIPA